jgi:HEPN domain-containing protein
MRIADARVLLRAGRHQGAYYLSGYAVECGLKACIAKQVRRYDFPDRKTVADSYTHNLDQLLKVAGLWPTHTAELRSNLNFANQLGYR